MSRPSADLIRGVPLFSDLDDKTVERLAGEFIERHFDEGAAIATEGVDGLNFFIVASGEASVTVHGERRRHARPGRLVRRGRARRQVGALGNGDRDDADGGVRAPDLELPAVRRAAPRARLEAPRDPRRATPRSPSPLDRPWPRPWTPRCPTQSSSPAAATATRRRGTRSSSASPATSRRSPPRRSACRRTMPRTSSRTSSLRVYERLDSLRSDEAIRPWIGQLTRNCCLDLLRSSGRVVPVEERRRAGRGRRDRDASTRR